MSQPLVSIVTVTFNLIKEDRSKTFIQCLESVRNQTYKNIEHIVIDGGSKDGSLELIQDYAKKGSIRYISEPDKGIYDAMNKGIRQSKGKYIAFLNSDDFYHSNSGVKASVKALEDKNADFSYAPVIMKYENGQLNTTHPQIKPEITHVFFTMPFCHQTMFVKRDVLIKEKMFNTMYKSAGDYDLVLRLCLKNYRSIKVGESFVTFKMEGVSNTNQDQSLKETAKIYKNLYSTFSDISNEDSTRIYDNQYAGISPKLAQKLIKCHYFDHEAYTTFLDEQYKKLAKIIQENSNLKSDIKNIHDSRSWKIAKIISKLATITHLK